MTRAKPPKPAPKPRGVRFPDPMRLRLMALAQRTHRTFSDMVIHACAKGLAALDQEKRDRAEGERIRREKKRP